MFDVVDTTRLLLVVDPEGDCAQLLPKLGLAGWKVATCALDSLSPPPSDVGLMCLGYQQLQRPEAVKELIRRSSTEWIAVLSQDMLRTPGVSNFISEWFFDFHTLPFDVERLQITLGRAFGMARLRQHDREFEGALDCELLGRSKAMEDLRRLICKLASTDSTVLIHGESGTGKELVARTLHRQSRRRGGPFVAVNCGAIPEQLIQSELFGHEKGAFTGAHQRKIGRFELANGGTLLLDEVADLPLDLQANLLRVLQERQIERVGGTQPIPIDVRVLAATHVDLEKAIEAGRFREDLYYRLNVLQVETLPLRERIEDVPLLADSFLEQFSQEVGRRPRRFSESAVAAMKAHSWPGNVRELANRVRRGLALAEGRQIEAADLGLSPRKPKGGMHQTLEEYKLHAERQALCEALAECADNCSQAARLLGISRPTFYRLLSKHGIR
ncbi:sigma-54 dependent transcriptional regulator [Zestomonas thermotolerans]|uniref:sigma-54 dependent transcriptional regulator n=1 Tax=Zestomonas thermotolerans TaxID=157784 RepID=UPI0023EFE35A|nr:sigma-54 dependent transcriptional regulator [Pseudomonas thermotolerans]